MTAAAYTLEKVAGVGNEQRLGQYRAKMFDVKWLSTISNGTADATITAATLGFSHIVGAQYMGEGGASGTISDHPDACALRLNNAGSSLVVTATAAGSALDLDSTDIASVRLLVWGI